VKTTTTHPISSASIRQTAAGDGPIRALWQVSTDELGVAWPDGEVTIIGTRALRLDCPCAACVDEFSGKPLLDPETVPADVTLESIHSVGRYGLQPAFSDGHRTGIYSFERLRALTKRA